MGRAPNPGPPQRVSAHVVPKAPSFSTDDEDEKTTIESGGWEDEASTTVEQGEAAEKVRALGLGLDAARRPSTGITSTNGNGMSDEPTVDDQRGNAALALLPPPNVARLVITEGNDSGQAIEVRPGKTYTIGRALDNDLVLTDITASRKHFDLRNENGSWVLADRGSGNGTLVNNRLEDAPFMLASGDMIEIGNTTFRFDVLSGPPRPPLPSLNSSRDDDDEPSTMSGKALEPEPATPERMAPVGRPKTLPPPAPLPRLRPSTNRPLAGYALDRPGYQPPSQSQSMPPVVVAAASAPTIGPHQGVLAANAPTIGPHQAMPALAPSPAPATTLPMPQMANRPPLQPSALLDPALGPIALPTTLPGQGPPLQPAHPARLPFSYPGSSERPKLQPRGSRSMIVASTQPNRDATSTAQVQPMSYANGQPAIVPASPYMPVPSISRRVKMVLGAVGLALFAAIATIAIIKGATGAAEPPKPTVEPAPPKPATVARPTVEPIRDSTAAPPADPRPAPIITPIPTPAPPPPPNAAAPTRVPPPPTTTTAPPPMTATLPPQPPAKITAPPAPATAAPPAPTPPAAAIASAKPDSDKIEIASTRPDKKPIKRPERKPERRSVAPRPEAPRPEIERPEKPDKPEAVAPRTEKKHWRTTQDVKTEAGALYRAKNFSGAAAVVTQSLPSFSGGDIQELKSLAAIYSQLGKAYNVGMAPGTKPTDAYQALRRALNYDRDVGSAYIAEIQERLVVTAARAAVQYMAAKEYESAFQAVRWSESLGSQSPTNKAVREKLESVAGELLGAAAGEQSTNPEDAKRKAHQVQGMVDTKSQLYARATKLLNGS